MFVVGGSYISLLQAVVPRCKDVMLAYITEVADDGVVLAGIELDVPCPADRCGRRRVFLWSYPEIIAMHPYEQVAFQAIVFLQSVYGFVVVDYNYLPFLYYRRLAEWALNVLEGVARRFDCAAPCVSVPFFPPSFAAMN